MNRSEEELQRSRSCHWIAFSYAGMIKLRMTRASPQICSQRIGFRFCGIVDEPTCFFASNASEISPISLRCKIPDFCCKFLHAACDIC